MTIKVFGELPGPNSKKPYVNGNVLALSSSLLTPTTAEPLPRHGVEGKFGSRIQEARLQQPLLCWRDSRLAVIFANHDVLLTFGAAADRRGKEQKDTEGGKGAAGCREQ